MSNIDEEPGDDLDRVAKSAARDAERTDDEPDAQTKEGERQQEVEQRKAKPASLRAEDAEAMVVQGLQRRIDVIQAKLDDREADARKLLPRNAELEQSCRTSKDLSRDGGIILTFGGGLIGVAGVISESSYIRYPLVALGVGFFFSGLWICKILNRNVWPPDR